MVRVGAVVSTSTPCVALVAGISVEAVTVVVVPLTNSAAATDTDHVPPVTVARCGTPPTVILTSVPSGTLIDLPETVMFAGLPSATLMMLSPVTGSMVMANVGGVRLTVMA